MQATPAPPVNTSAMVPPNGRPPSRLACLLMTLYFAGIAAAAVYAAVAVK